MASTAVSWTPTSLQLRLALNYGSFRVPVGAKTAKRKRQFRLLCVGQKAETRRDLGGWNGSGHFGGWLDSGECEKSAASSARDWLKGTLVAGAAWLILVSGLTFAVLSLGRGNVLRPKEEGVPTVAQEEAISVAVGKNPGDKNSTDVNVGNSAGPQDSTERNRESIDAETVATSTSKENQGVKKASEGSNGRHASSMELQGVDKQTSQVESRKRIDDVAINQNQSYSESPFLRSFVSYKGIPAPSTSPQINPVKLLFPLIVDPVQGQTFAALQALKVIQADALPSDLCTRREFARWLVSASNALSRNSVSKVYPAMYIEGVTELAFDDVTPEDPDFPFIQGLAEAGLISSRLSNPNSLIGDHSQFLFFPESPLSRQDLVSWKMALENRQLPEADGKKLYQLSGFVDIDKINPEAWPALIADISAGEQGIIALAFGCTRLFQPYKPVTKAQAATALVPVEAFEALSEELVRIEAESMAEHVVSAHNSLVAQVEKDINASFEKELLGEREKADAVEKMAEEVKMEMEKLRAQREEETLTVEKERIAIELEMEALSKLRNELEEQLQSFMSNKAEISYDRERIDKLRKQVEDENQEILRLKNELEVERNALSAARSWAEDEARRAREHAKALEEARGRWEKHGIRVVVDSDLCEEAMAKSTWLNAGKQFSVDGTMNRARNLIRKLKLMAKDVGGKSRELIHRIIQQVSRLITALKERFCEIWNKAEELRVKAGSKTEELKRQTSLKVEEIRNLTIQKVKTTVEEAEQGVSQLRSMVKDNVKLVAEECRVGVGKLTEKFKTT